MLNISCRLFAWQTIHMKYQVLFSLKNDKITLRLLSATDLLRTFRAKYSKIYSSHIGPKIKLTINKVKVTAKAGLIKYSKSINLCPAE